MNEPLTPRSWTPEPDRLADVPTEPQPTGDAFGSPGMPAVDAFGSQTMRAVGEIGSPVTPVSAAPSPYVDPAGRPGHARRPGDALMQDGRDLVDWVTDPVGTVVGRATDHWPRPLRWLAQIGAEVAEWVVRGRFLDLLLRR